MSRAELSIRRYGARIYRFLLRPAESRAAHVSGRRLSDPEVLELLRDEPKLLAIADAVYATQKPPSTSRFHRSE